MTDAAWCRENEISINTFYNAIQRLRKKACEVPPPSRPGYAKMDLTSHAASQDVVKVGVLPDTIEPTAVAPIAEAAPLHTAAPIQIDFGHGRIEISNDANPMLVAHLVSALGGCL